MMTSGFTLVGMVSRASLSWILFGAVLVNQTGRVMVPSVMTSVLADPHFDVTPQSRGFMLAGVSAVCLAGKFLGAAVTDRLGGWLMLVLVFVSYTVSSLGLVLTSIPMLFAAMWWLNSLAYTIAWGAACQVIGMAYSEAERPAQLSRVASASRFGATLGSMLFGWLLKSGMSWRATLLPVIPVQILLCGVCSYLCLAGPIGEEKSNGTKIPSRSTTASSPPSEETSPWRHVKSLNFWLMFIPKASAHTPRHATSVADLLTWAWQVVLFTYTQFFMNFVGPLLHSNYGFDHGDATALAGIAQAGAVLGLLVVGDLMYKKLTPAGKQLLVR